MWSFFKCVSIFVPLITHSEKLFSKYCLIKKTQENKQTNLTPSEVLKVIKFCVYINESVIHLNNTYYLYKMWV